MTIADKVVTEFVLSDTVSKYIDERVLPAAPTLTRESLVDVARAMYDYQVEYIEDINYTVMAKKYKAITIVSSQQAITLFSFLANVEEGANKQRVVGDVLSGHVAKMILVGDWVDTYLYAPEWAEYKKRIEVQKSHNIIKLPITNQYRCARCTKKEAYYQVVQIRSADEAPSVLLECVSCQYKWKHG